MQKIGNNAGDGKGSGAVGDAKLPRSCSDSRCKKRVDMLSKRCVDMLIMTTGDAQDAS